MASFLKRKANSASLENHFSGINISLEEEMIMTKDADNEVDSAEAEVAQIEAAENIYDLWNDKGLNFEKLKGTENSYSMRLKLKYRLEMEIDWINSELTIGDFLITDISNHYS